MDFSPQSSILQANQPPLHPTFKRQNLFSTEVTGIVVDSLPGVDGPLSFFRLASWARGESTFLIVHDPPYKHRFFGRRSISLPWWSPPPVVRVLRILSFMQTGPPPLPKSVPEVTAKCFLLRQNCPPLFAYLTLPPQRFFSLFLVGYRCTNRRPAIDPWKRTFSSVASFISPTSPSSSPFDGHLKRDTYERTPSMVSPAAGLVSFPSSFSYPLYGFLTVGTRDF